MEIAIYSGTFDPIHIGHAIVANHVSQFGSVDSLWLTVSRLNPFKVGHEPSASDEQRLAMASLVAQKCSNVEICDIELHMDYPSYSFLTLSELKRRYPEHNFRLVIGSDNWPCFSQWRQADDIISQFGLIIYPRPGWEMDGVKFPDNVRYLREAPLLEISSTSIRSLLREGKNVEFLVPSNVNDYIKQHSIYTS